MADGTLFVFGNSTSALVYLCLTSLLLTSLGLTYLRYLYTDHHSIDGLPEPAGASLIYGHLPLLGRDHASKAEHIARENSWPIFQVRLGCKRVVILNGFQAARDWLVINHSATITRPMFYTFHKVVSKTSGTCATALSNSPCI